MNQIGKQTFVCHNVYIEDSKCVVGPLEGKGPLAPYYDYVFSSLRNNQKSWEEAEISYVKKAYELVTKEKKINLIIGGDLQNQSIITPYAFRNQNIPVFCVYGACSSFSLTLLTAAQFLPSYPNYKIACITSSHHSACERQFRAPTEYGGYRPESMTFTATGASATIVSNLPSKLEITAFTIGSIVDVGCKDPLDLGSAMAPAAITCLEIHLQDLHRSITDYDAIFTGDLSYYGSKIFSSYFQKLNIPMFHYYDCGNLIYDPKEKKVCSGASGCASMAIVSSSVIFKLIQERRYKRVLLISTGALHNPMMILQKNSIPCVAHAICIERT